MAFRVNIRGRLYSGIVHQLLQACTMYGCPEDAGTNSKRYQKTWERPADSFSGVYAWLQYHESTIYQEWVIPGFVDLDQIVFHSFAGSPNCSLRGATPLRRAFRRLSTS